MNTRWPLVPLEEMLVQDKRYVDRPEPRTYPKLSVKLYGKGVTLDAPADGATLKMQRHQIAEAGQVILSEIWGKKGAIGIVPPEGNGALCTSHFFLFDILRKKIQPEYLQVILRANYLAEQLESEARGTTGYAAVRPQHLLRALVPLAPIPEQRRIVAWIAQIAAKVEEAYKLRAKAENESEQLLTVMAHRPDLDDQTKRRRGWAEVSLRDVIRQVQDRHRVATDGVYPNLGILSFGRGLFEKPPIEGARTSARELNRVAAGQFIYSRLFAFEGAYGMVGEKFDGCFVSNEYPTFECDQARVTPEFLEAYFRLPVVWAEVAMGSKGLGHRRQRVQPDLVLSHRLMLPPLPQQRRIRDVRRFLERLRALQSRAASELDAVLPSVIHKKVAWNL